MTTAPKVITGPLTEVISLTEAKLHARVDGSTENDLFVNVYIPAARAYFEDHAAYAVHEQTLEITLDRWPYGNYIELPRATPLISVTSVIYYSQDGTAATWSPSDYIVDIDSVPGRIYRPNNTTWPSPLLRYGAGVRIRYVAGIEITSPLTEAPGGIKLPILMLVAGMYEQRESETFTDRASITAVSMRYGVEAFIARIRDKVACSSY